MVEFLIRVDEQLYQRMDAVAKSNPRCRDVVDVMCRAMSLYLLVIDREMQGEDLIFKARDSGETTTVINL